MSLLRQVTAFPMLRKELVERATRPRTYAIRVIYALLFFTIFLWNYLVIVGTSNHALAGLKGLGSGNELFLSALWIQWIGIFVFLPAMMSGLITEEKERGTLALLLLSDIAPLEAVLQKYLAGLIPMLTLLLLTLPVGGFAYMLGGLTIGMVVFGTLILVVTAGTVGAVAIACSSYARTTIGSFIGTYGILGLLFLLPTRFPLQSVMNDWVLIIGFLYMNAIIAGWALVFGCVSYKRRAHVAPRFHVRRGLHALDHLLKRLNDHIGGIDVLRDGGTLPAAQPILWREKHRRQLGQLRYQIRYILILEAIVLLIATLSPESVPYASLAAWVLGLLILTVQASNLIVSERLSQTLDILLSTPLSGATIVREKAYALAPLAMIIALPILSLATIEALTNFALQRREMSILPFVLWEALHLILFLTLSVVIGVAVGLGARSRLSAMMKAIGVLCVLSTLPHLLAWSLNFFRS